RAGGMMRGTTVAGRYRLKEAIGSGGMGTVWRAGDLHQPHDVALKIIPVGVEQRQLNQGLAAVAAFRDREGHLLIHQRDTVTVDGEEFKVGQWLKNLRKRWDKLPPEHLQAVTEAGLTPSPAPTSAPACP
ncbi:Helicase associated domain protein, partial [Streptomyces hayashii]|uniref:Helicase associated domain protein n=1 Tax=Streptomyces hayashii TaxID=2839966 RepID=UPI00403C5238